MMIGSPNLCTTPAILQNFVYVCENVAKNCKRFKILTKFCDNFVFAKICEHFRCGAWILAAEGRSMKNEKGVRTSEMHGSMKNMRKTEPKTRRKYTSSSADPISADIAQLTGGVSTGDPRPWSECTSRGLGSTAHAGSRRRARHRRRCHCHLCLEAVPIATATAGVAALGH